MFLATSGPLLGSLHGALERRGVPGVLLRPYAYVRGFRNSYYFFFDFLWA